ncbi:MAG: hypothetical protein N3A58_07960, partial [Spirochaetes bacterium]|nr:hypothetical protein [Spirochaetota bacterium]
MKLKINSKNPLWIFAFFLFYIIYFGINLSFKNIILIDLLITLFLVMIYVLLRIKKRYLFFSFYFIFSLIFIKLIFFIIKFNIKEYKESLFIKSKLLFLLNDLYYYINFNLIVLFFNCFIFSFIFSNIIIDFI